MQITLNDGNVKTTDAMVRFVREKLSAALARIEPIGPVTVSLTDDNGPRGGEDKRVTIRVAAAGLGKFMAEHSAADFYDAVTRAAGKLKRGVGQALARRRRKH